MKEISIIIMVSIVLEGLVEYAKTIIHMVEEREYKTAITQAITIVLGIFLAFAFHLRLFSALSEIFEGLSVNETIDIVLTGILFSRGSNYISDLISRLTHKDSGRKDSGLTEGDILAINEDGIGNFAFEYDDAEDGEEDVITD